ncbi:MAG: hypothetical protein ACRDHD_04825 [Candidatus Limnocylindria bacterium]
MAYTGTEMLIWGGVVPGFEPIASGAAFDPAADTWRLLSESPLPGGVGQVSAWTGSEWIIVEAGAAGDVERDSGRATAYNPETDTWRPIPRAPIPDGWASTAVWTGNEFLIIRIGTDEDTSGTAYAPALNAWTAIPANPALTELDTFPLSVWVGDAVLLFGGEPASVWEYHPADRTWQEAARLPEGLTNVVAPVWTGVHVVFYQPGGRPSYAYTPETRTWTELPAAPDRNRENWQAAWTGREILVWGGSNPHGSPTTTDGMSLRLDR